VTRALVTAGAAVLCSAACSAAPASKGSTATGSAAAGGNGGISSVGGARSSGGTPGTGASNTGTGTGVSTGGSPIGYALDCAAPATGKPVLRLLTRYEFENTINDVFPSVKGQWTNSLPAGTVASTGFDNDVSNTPGNQLVAALSETAESVATSVVGSAFAGLLSCSTTSADRGCAGQFLDKYGRRLFRRPLTQSERNRYLAFFDSARASADFKTAMKWVTVGLVQSPHAVFRSEVGTLANGTRQLSPYEIASELSYTFTGSTPSEDLLDQAAKGTLTDRVALAKALLATEAGKRVVQRFFEGYLGYTRVTSIAKPNITSPAFESLAPDMVQETRTFIDQVVLQKGGGLVQLLTATTTNPSKNLAAYYGFSAPASDYAPVSRPDGRGIGVLAQGSFLASHANGDASSPTRRGLFAYYRLLCRPPLLVPPDVPSLGEASVTKTTRQRYESAHMTQGKSCPVCHKQFDPIGFGFEHFDEGGRYRATEGGEPIDAAATVPGPTGDPLFAFESQEELVAGFVEQPIVYQCFSAYLAAYAFGTSESCLGASQVAALEQGSLGIVDAFAALADEAHFTQRQAE